MATITKAYRSWRPVTLTRFVFKSEDETQPHQGVAYEGVPKTLLRRGDILSVRNPQGETSVGGITLERYLQEYLPKGYSFVQEALREEKAERPKLKEFKDYFHRNTLVEMVEGRNAAFEVYAYWVRRTTVGDPLFDLWMGDAKASSLKALVELDRAIMANLFSVASNDPEWPEATDEVYRIVREVRV